MLKIINRQEENEDEREKADNQVDKEEVFLRQFPGMSDNYRDNKQLVIKNKNRPNFDLKSGGWMPPSFCSMLVNVVQFILTFQSLLMYRNSVIFYWQPNNSAAHLESHFRSIQDVTGYWGFVEENLTPMMFQEFNILNADGDVNENYLGLWDEQEYTKNSRGRVYVGPIRFLQKRVKVQPCARASDIDRYKDKFKECYPNRYSQENEDTEDI